jgi:hypothetical protein
MEVTSVHFLKTRLCFGRSDSDFELLDLKTFDTQSLLDLVDRSLEFTHKGFFFSRGPRLTSLALHRVKDDFLVCYKSELLRFCLFLAVI